MYSLLYKQSQAGNKLPTFTTSRRRDGQEVAAHSRETAVCRYVQKCEVDDAAGEQLAPGLWLSRVTSVTQQCNVFTYSLTHDTQSPSILTSTTYYKRIVT